MSLWSTVKGWVDANATQLTFAWLPSDADEAAVRPNQDYFRLWIADMFLAKSKRWTVQQYPAVHAAVRLRFSGREGTELTSMARPPQGATGPGVLQHYPMTSLLPYYGGVVEFEATLSSLNGDSGLDTALGILQEASRLVGPPLAQAVQVAGVVSSGVDRLLGGQNGTIVLAAHQALGLGGGPQPELRAGHLVVIDAPAGTYAGGSLSVRDGRVLEDGAPLEGVDHLLFAVERRAERDDWRFADLEDLIGRAVDALAAGDQTAFGAFRNAALAKTLKSPDLTVPDRGRVARAIRDELDEVQQLGLGATGDAAPSLEAIITRHAMPVEEAGLQPLPSLDDLLARAT